ncbi:MAG: hypothetical protein JNN17_17130 [Verrucomicrobiaceae bacterium]|nr:hypothetical protein [Verrucomicrobiaceae bacterium]
MKLTWHDLLIDNVSVEQWREWLLPWNGVVKGDIAPIFMNKFGSWFFRHSSGEIGMFNVLTGCHSVVAETQDQFVKQVNREEWQQEFLLSKSILTLRKSGKILSENQCYAICPHPALGGINPSDYEYLDPKFVLPMGVRVWQSICAQSLIRCNQV